MQEVIEGKRNRGFKEIMIDIEIKLFKTINNRKAGRQKENSTSKKCKRINYEQKTNSYNYQF